MSDRKKIGEILQQTGSVGADQVSSALEAKKTMKRPKPLGQVLVDQGAVDEVAVAKALAHQLGLPYVDPLGETIYSAAVCKLPRRLAEQHKAFPSPGWNGASRWRWPTPATQ